MQTRLLPEEEDALPQRPVLESSQIRILLPERLRLLSRLDQQLRVREARHLQVRQPALACPEEVAGTRQSGLPDLKVASFADTQLLVEAREQAEPLWQQDPYLGAFEHRALRERVFLFWQKASLH